MSKCNECKREFPTDYLQPLFSSRGNTICCAICALAIKNKMHGLNDKEFTGEESNRLLNKTKKYLLNKKEK